MLSFFLQCVRYLQSAISQKGVEERSDFWWQVGPQACPMSFVSFHHLSWQTSELALFTVS